MLAALHIQDFLLIESLSLPLGPGLTALTGETGAGKSILLEALGLAAGGRTTRGGVRQGAARGIVSAAFDPPPDHAVWSLLEENGFSTEDDQIILRRVQNADGRGRAFINDQPASIASLRLIGGALLEIHGQHDGRGFLTVATHRALLDEYGGLTVAATKVRGLYRDWRDAEQALAAKKATFEQNAREADYLRHVTEELTALAVEASEEDMLAARRAELIAAEKTADDLSAAMQALSGDGLEGALAASAHRLTKAASKLSAGNDTLSNAIEKIDAALSEIMEARAAVEDAASRLTFDPDEIERVEDRLFKLRAAGRKHGVPVAQLPNVLARATEVLDALERGEADFVQLEKEVRRLATAYKSKATGLSTARIKAAAALDAAMATELAPLKLGKALFKTVVEANHEEPGELGIDHVEFAVATNAGSSLGPLKTVASGGELSRFVLALKAALAQKECRTVIIFDEVDAGVGGAVADAVGERLSRLAADAQVLVVTHSPQVAARADTHWLVEKYDNDAGATTTDVRVLGADERIEEVARMLSGATVTNEARAAAARLLGAPVPRGRRKKSA